MNAIVSVIAALVMIFNMGSGMMANLEEPVSFESSMNLQMDSLTSLVPGLEEGQQGQMVKLAVDILNAVGFRASADKQAVEMALTAGEDTLLSLGVRNAEDGLTVASSVLEGQALNMSADTLAQLNEQIASAGGMDQVNALLGAFAGIDREKMMQAFLDSMDHGVAAVKEKAGETETGTFTVDEFDFSSKTPVDMNDQEIVTVLVNMLKEYMEQEQFKQLFALTGTDMTAQLDSALQDIQNRAEEMKLDAVVTLYANADGEEYVTADLSREAKEGAEAVRMHVGFGTEFTFHRINITYETGDTPMSFVTMSLKDAKNWDEAASIVTPDGPEIFANFVSTENGLPDGVFGARYQGLFVRAIMTYQAEGGRQGYNVRILATPEGENVEDSRDIEIGSADISWGPGAALTSVFDGDGVQKIAIEPMLQGEGQAEMNSVMTGAMGGLMNALSKLISHLPEDSGAMIGGLLQGGTGAAPVE